MRCWNDAGTAERIRTVWCVFVGHVGPANRELAGYLEEKMCSTFSVTLIFFIALSAFSTTEFTFSSSRELTLFYINSVVHQKAIIRSAGFEVSSFYGTRRFITMNTKPRQRIISRLRSI